MQFLQPAKKFLKTKILHTYYTTKLTYVYKQLFIAIVCVECSDVIRSQNASRKLFAFFFKLNFLEC